MARRGEIRVSSRLAAPSEAIWERVITAAGVNDELRPLMRMTVPRGLEAFSIDGPAAASSSARGC